MTNIRYQVFISSTFRDLRDERQAVLDAVLSMNHFPAGMELFPASDSTPWEIIQRVIDDSDYYVLIVGGMYGSTDANGISYTEREYDYAKQLGKPVLAFLHEKPEDIPAGKVEMKPGARRKLSAFRSKLEAHHCSYWRDSKDLQYKVAVSLVHEINANPAVGWVRGNENAEAQGSRDAILAVQSATQEAYRQGRLREDAEVRAKAAEVEVEALRAREAEARAEAEAAGKREAAASARERAAEKILKKTKTKPYRRHATDATADVPPSFQLDTARKVLNNAENKINEMVIWAETPQGAPFWISEHERVGAGKRLSGEARKIIRHWVSLVEKRS